MDTLIELSVSVGYVAILVVLLFIAKLVNDAITPFNDDKVLVEDDNVAFGISRAGYYLSVVIVFLGATIGPMPIYELYDGLSSWLGAVAFDAMIASAYAFAGVLALNASRLIVDKAIMSKFSMRKEIIEDKNAGAGAVMFGTYTATALTIAAAINGVGGGPLTALAFFALGQIALIVFAKAYQFATPFDLHKEVERDNVAAGIAFGGTMIAVGLLVSNAIKGNFISWADNLINYGTLLAVGLPLLLILRIITDKVILPKSALSKEIAQDQNKGAAFIEAAIAVGVATTIFVMV